MTPKLMDRLARLEGAQAAQGGSTAMPPEIAAACLQAIAIGLGGYPRPPERHSPCRRDSIGDGFARGLGYTDRDDMEARLEADPGEWDGRIKAAEEALAAKYAPEPAGQGVGRNTNLRFLVGVLGEIDAVSTTEASRHWPSNQPHLDRAAAGIRRALNKLGIVPGGQTTEVSGCH